MKKKQRNKKQMIGPYTLQKNTRHIFCIFPDLAIMHMPESKLEKNQKEHYEQDRLIDPVEAIVWCLITQKKDEIFLDSSQLKEKNVWDWHFDIFRKFGLAFSDKLHFVPANQVYEAALSHAKPDQILVSRCFSYELQKYAEVDDLLESSRKANSKVEFVKNALKYSFKIPPSISAKKSLLTPGKVRKAFGDNHGALMLKADGMGGGYNVMQFTNADEITGIMEPYSSNTKFVVQKKIDESFTEFAADFVIYPDRVELLYYRFALMTDSGWQGNIFCPDLKMNAVQISNLFNCANAVRKLGYCSEQGFMCGIDFFQNEHIQFVTEINARWTVPAPYGFLLNKLNLSNLTVFLYKEMISDLDVRRYQEFVMSNLYYFGVELGADQFALMPLGLGPVTADMKRHIILFVFGNFQEFVRTVKEQFSKDSFNGSSQIVKLFNKRKKWFRDVV